MVVVNRLCVQVANTQKSTKTQHTRVTTKSTNTTTIAGSSLQATTPTKERVSERLNPSKSNLIHKRMDVSSSKPKLNSAKRRTPPPTSSMGSESNHSLNNMSDRISSNGSNGPLMHLTSEEVNFLIFRYLQEAGFVHSAFTFLNESMISKSNVSRSDVPPGALITFLQKGLQYVGIEETIRQDGSDPQPDKGNGKTENDIIDFSLLSPNAIKALVRRDPPIKLNVPQEAAAAAIRAKLETESKTQGSNKRPSPQASQRWAQTNGAKQAAQAMAMMNQQNFNGNEAAAAKAVAAKALASVAKRGGAKLLSNSSAGSKSFNSDSNSASTAEAAAILANNMQLNHQERKNFALTQQQIIEFDKEDLLSRTRPDEVLELTKHTSEVFMCAWNPIFTDLLATGSGDASARIWTMGGKTAQAGSGACRLLQHGSNSTDKKNKDVTTLEWSPDGELLATGSYDGVARVWKRDGTIVHTLQGHLGPIFSLKWNKSGNYLLSGSYDKTTIVWNVTGGKGEVKQQFHNHTAPALDVDWKDDETFASCSTDKSVLICRVGLTTPLKKFLGHTDEVNAVKWDPSGTYLASCSDDYTAKVWIVSSSRNEPLHDFKSHKQEIYTVKWSPTGPGSKNPSKPLMLATASFDGTVRLWNVNNGSCISILQRHRDSVYSVSFSPSGEYLASGSLAGQLYIWNVQDGKPIRNFKGKGDIFEVAWNVEETRVAACFSSNVVNVIDFHQ